MEVVSPNHTFEFIMWGVPKFMSAIAAARDLLLPAQSEALRVAVHSSPEKWGDGLKVFPPLVDI